MIYYYILCSSVTFKNLDEQSVLLRGKSAFCQRSACLLKFTHFSPVPQTHTILLFYPKTRGSDTSINILANVTGISTSDSDGVTITTDSVAALTATALSKLQQPLFPYLLQLC